MRAPHVPMLAALSLLCAACASDFTPGSVLTDLRVLAMVASPLEVGPDDSITVSAVVVPPPQGQVATERWTFCPLSAGSSAAYACAVPTCEVELPAAPGGPVTATPGALARDCLARLSGSGVLPPGVPAQLPAVVTTLFRYVVTATDGERREAVQRVPLYPGGAPANRNTPPVITGVQIGGRALAPGDVGPALSPGHDLPVHVYTDPASAQTYVDEAGVTITETIVVSFHTTAARFDYDRANGPDAEVTLQYDHVAPTDVEATLWVVARDLRGGETVSGPYRVPIAR